MRSTLILGIGNVDLADEGTGVHAMRALARRTVERADLTLLDGGTLSVALAPLCESVDELIVIDAANLGARPGSVQSFVGPAMDRFVVGVRVRTAHEAGLHDLFAVLALKRRLPFRRALVGVEPARIARGGGLSVCVATSIPRVCDEALALVETWRLLDRASGRLSRTTRQSESG